MPKPRRVVRIPLAIIGVGLLGGLLLILGRGKQNMSAPKTAVLSGMVIDQNGSPIAGAKIRGKYGALVSRDLNTTTNANGGFEAQRLLVPLVLHATAPDRGMAGIANVMATASGVTIRIGPTATVSGRLIGETGDVLPGAKLQCGIRVDHEESGTSELAFGSTATTDESGRYTLSRLVPGYKYEVTYIEHSKPEENVSPTVAPPVRTVATVLPERAAFTDLGDTALRRLSRPTTNEQIAKLLDAKRPKGERIAEALSVANREQTRVLLVIGDEQSAAGRALLELLYEDDEIRECAWNYERIAIDTQDAVATSHVAKEYNVNIGDPAKPTLVVLGSEGMAAAQRVFGETGPDRNAVLSFLANNAPDLDDAEKILADALERAGTENKRVLVQYSASWCGPCRLLSSFFDRHNDLFDSDFVRVKIDVDRSPNGQELMERQRLNGESIGIPWFAILDAEGTILATSDGPDGNIGFPSAQKEIHHFVSMVEQTAIRLSGNQLKDIRLALEARS